jgi:BirA family biotin operon repressor/biotin-[acetyl-CoA-carboxylase] ligase
VPVFGFKTIPSTDRAAWEFLASGRVPPFVVIADRQSAGRGQRGRRWLSETGGLYLSLALAPDLAVDRHPHLVLAVAWGIASRLRSHGIPVALKWPNDLVIGGQKLGGIKIETRVRSGKISRAVIGVGINWCNPVPATGVNLRAFLTPRYGRALDSLERLAAVTIDAIRSGYDYYLARDIEGLLAAYLRLFDNLGQTVTIDGRTGTVTGVNARGELTVRVSSAGASTEICLPSGRIKLGYPR